MSLTIALAGKGGVGKTTVAGLLVRYMTEKNLRPILAVDADSNANLNEVLGLPEPPTLGDAREEMKSIGAQQPNMTKDMLIEMRVNEALVEEKDFDLLVMGRPEGPGCYCAANAVLTASLESLLDNYPYIVIDNEAGMEHLSRVVAKRIDHLIVVSDPSRRALVTAGRILELVRSLPLSLGSHYLIVNQVPDGRLSDEAEGVIAGAGLNLIGVIPDDEVLAQMDAQGQPIVKELPDSSPVVRAAWKVFDGLKLGEAP
ncbi:MAG: AAA family ATPase [Deltaproteobacteria bacterium]|nr:AAA family ATPase [Deltaproteobacteria bacterium]